MKHKIKLILSYIVWVGLILSPAYLAIDALVTGEILYCVGNNPNNCITVSRVSSPGKFYSSLSLRIALFLFFFIVTAYILWGKFFGKKPINENHVVIPYECPKCNVKGYIVGEEHLGYIVNCEKCKNKSVFKNNSKSQDFELLEKELKYYV